MTSHQMELIERGEPVSLYLYHQRTHKRIHTLLMKINSNEKTTTEFHRF